MIFECRKSERVNAHGEVTARGAEWCEPQEFIETAMFTLGQFCWQVAGIVAFFGCIFGALLRVDVIAERGLVFGGLIFALGLALIWFGARFPATRRSLLFRRDGFIVAPHGVAGVNGSVGKWSVRHDGIMNIEAAPKKGLRRDSETEYTHCVRLLSETGKTYRVANNLEEDQARRVVAALISSLNTIRSEIAVEVGDFVDIT